MRQHQLVHERIGAEAEAGTKIVQAMEEGGVLTTAAPEFRVEAAGSQCPLQRLAIDQDVACIACSNPAILAYYRPSRVQISLLQPGRAGRVDRSNRTKCDCYTR